MRRAHSAAACLLFLLLPVTETRAQEFRWARQLGGTEFISSADVALDSGGSVYTVGDFVGTADFDPGPGTYNLTSAGFSNAYISKLDSAGNFVWARQFMGTEGTEHVSGFDVAVDASGNVIAVGDFVGTADFDPGPGTYNLTSAGSPDAFISKLDSAGNFVWARQLMGTETGFVRGFGVAVDAGGSVHTVGDFAGTVDFDPGTGAHHLTTAAGALDAFISKLDGAGNFVWARVFTGTEFVSGFRVAVDADGNVHTVGDFIGTADFNPGSGTHNLTSTGSPDVFISKLDGAGSFIWARQFMGTEFASGYGIATDSDGNVHTVGHFRGTVDFDPGPGDYSLTTAGSGIDAFISKLDGAGNLVWTRRFGGTDIVSGFDVALDSGGHVYTVGHFRGTVDFDPGPGTHNLTGGADAFISKLDSSGNFAWVRQFGEGSFANARTVAVDSGGNVHSVGVFSGTVDFDPGPESYYLAAVGDTDTFISKLGNPATGPDVTPPVLIVPGTVTVDASSPAGAVVSYSVSVTDDLDPHPTVSCTPPSGSTFPVGTTTVRCLATDASGNSAAASFEVVVGDFVDQAGQVPDGARVPGSPLTIASAPGSQVTLRWGQSCLSTDTDYEVYEGVLGAFTSHMPRACSTGGASTFTLTPPAGSVYYLVVPRSAGREGSYGTDSAGRERPAGTSACLPQAVKSCR